MSENEIKPVAWCADDDSRNEWAFAWEGHSRRPWHIAPLYDQSAIDRLTAERDDWRRQAQYEADVSTVAVQEVGRLKAERDAAIEARDADMAELLRHRRDAELYVLITHDEASQWEQAEKERDTAEAERDIARQLLAVANELVAYQTRVIQRLQVES